MKIKKKIVVIFVISAGLILQCSESKKSKEDNSTISPEIESLITKIKHIGAIPYKLDLDKIRSMSTDEWKTNSTLNSDEVRLLGDKLMDSGLSANSWFRIGNFLLIDSLKSNGLYEEYEANTEFPVVSAQANIGEKININKSAFILLWAVYNEGVDGSGTFVFGTFFQNNRPENTALLGGYSEGGDGSYYSEVKTTSTITDTVINIINEVTQGYDGADEDKRITNEKCRITDKGLIIQKSQQPVSKNKIPSFINNPPTVTIIVPEHIDTYKTAMIEYVQDCGPNSLNSMKFVKKVKKISNAALIKATAQVAANEMYSHGTSIEYFKILNDTAYIVLEMHIDAWAGVSVALSEVEPVVEKTLLQFPEVNKVIFAMPRGMIHHRASNSLGLRIITNNVVASL